MASGTPINIIASFSFVYSAILNSASFDSFNKMSCVKRSLQVYPVTHNSGNTITFAPFATVSSIILQIFCVL